MYVRDCLLEIVCIEDRSGLGFFARAFGHIAFFPAVQPLLVRACTAQSGRLWVHAKFVALLTVKAVVGNAKQISGILWVDLTFCEFFQL